MHSALRNHFAIEMCQLLQKPDVLEQHGPRDPCGEHILIVTTGQPLVMVNFGLFSISLSYVLIKLARTMCFRRLG